MYSMKVMAQTKGKKSRTKWYVLLAIIVIGTVSGVIYARRPEPPTSVELDKATRRNLTEVVMANGRIQPVLQVKISPEVSGEIIALPVKEGQRVKKGDLLLKIKPDFYLANKNQAEANYNASVASKASSEASLSRARLEFLRHDELYKKGLVPEATYVDMKAGFEMAQAGYQASLHQVEMANANLARAREEWGKTTIVSPLDGTISKLNSELGERVVGTATMAGTDVMTIADLSEMEARVDIVETDVVIIGKGQKVKLEVDAFRDVKFNGLVTDIANSSKGLGVGGRDQMGGQSQEATKFEVRIRLQEKVAFRPGMSVTAEIETRYRTNALAVPISSVTTRLIRTNAMGQAATSSAVAAHADKDKDKVPGQDHSKDGKKSDANKPVEVVFAMDGDKVKAVPVKRGIMDDTYMEILEGLKEGQEVVSGPFKAIARILEDGKKVLKATPNKAQGGAAPQSK